MILYSDFLNRAVLWFCKVCSSDALIIRERITGDPWIHLCNGYLLVYILLNRRIYVLLKINTVILKLAKRSTVKSCDAVLRIILIYVRNFVILKYSFFLILDSRFRLENERVVTQFVQTLRSIFCLHLRGK